VVIVFALLAALSNAVSVTTRHVASVGDPHKSAGWRLIIYLLRNPVWLLGWAAQAAAFVFQALALHNGEVSVVQPLLVTELVITLMLRRVWLRPPGAAAAWLAWGWPSSWSPVSPRAGTLPRPAATGPRPSSAVPSPSRS
jgi:hypothetical protein